MGHDNCSPLDENGLDVREPGYRKVDGQGSFSDERPGYVDSRFEIAASRMAEPRAGWPAAAPPRLGQSPGSIHRRPLEVETGFLVSDVRTLDQCDLARSILIDAINSIDGQLDAAVTRDRSGGAKLDLEWQRKARGALRAKNVAIEEVELIRKRLVHEGRADATKSKAETILAHLRATHPEIVAEAETAAASA